MLFMLALDILLIACGAKIVLAIRSILTSPDFDNAQAGRHVALFFSIAAFGVAGLLYGLLPGPIARTNWSPMLFGVFGLAASCAFLIDLRKVAREHKTQHHRGISLRLGWFVVCVLTGTYMILACIDHYWFLRADPDRVGMVHAGIGGVADGLQICNDDILVRLKSNTAEYRCPRLFVFGRDTDAPFIPWPYDAGSSVELAERLARLEAQTIPMRERQ
jgi:hypothetical protein